MDPLEELVSIGGIGARRARWLVESLGVRSVAELGALSPEELERKVRDPALHFPRPFPTRSQIESWVAEAKARQPIGSVEPAAGPEAVEKPEVVPEAPTSAAPETAAPEIAAPAVGPTRVEVTAPRLPPRVADLRATAVDGDGLEGINLIRIDKPWSIVFDWAPEDPGSLPSGGDWQLGVVCRPLAGSQALSLGERSTDVPAEPSRERYHGAVEVPAGVVNASYSDSDYRGIATVAYRWEQGTDALVAALVDLGVLRFYDPTRRSTAT